MVSLYRIGKANRTVDMRLVLLFGIFAMTVMTVYGCGSFTVTGMVDVD